MAAVAVSAWPLTIDTTESTPNPITFSACDAHVGRHSSKLPLSEMLHHHQTTHLAQYNITLLFASTHIVLTWTLPN